MAVSDVLYDKGGAIYNVLASGYGVTGNGSTDDRGALNTLANTTIPGAGGVMYFPPGTYKIGSALAFPSTVSLEFAKGAKLAPVSGVTATINGPVVAGLWQIFAARGTSASEGTVVLGSASAPVLFPQWWGALTGADDLLAIQAALDACLSYNTVCFSGGPYIISNQLSISTDHIRVAGSATIKAKDSADFSTMIVATARTGVVIELLEFDVNKSGRLGVQTAPLCGIGLNGCYECTVLNATVRNARGYGGASATAIAVSDGHRIRIDGCRVLDCGDSGYDSDGVYSSGEQTVIIGCEARNCTDTAFVIENSNYALVSGCTAMNCTVACGITGATVDTWRGNVINGLTGSTSLSSSTGQIQIASLTSMGQLLESEVSNISLTLNAGAAGGGPAINVRSPAGRVIGLTLANVRISGAQTQGIVIDADDVVVVGTRIQGTTDACIQFQTGALRGYVADCYLVGGSYGVGTNGTSEVIVQGNVCRDQSQFGVYAGGTSTVRALFNTVLNSTVQRFGKDSGATLNLVGWDDGRLALNNASGSAPTGTQVNKVLITDKNGSTLGYVPVYNT